jgi:undecaprenyl diphosphate synthase
MTNAESQKHSHLPTHVAFIMDGNGRWAERQGKPRLEGHRQGVETVKKVCDWLLAAKIPYATFYAFSTENWKRPEEEVSGLFNLMRLYFRQEMKQLGKKNIRVRFIGDRRPGKLAKDIIDLMAEVEEMTGKNTALTVQFAINYSGHNEIVRAAQALAEQAVQGALAPTAITAEAVAAALDTAGVPDPDFVIRTSGEMRVSNFLLWQMAYSEFYFSDVAWPDFGATHLQAALSAFTGRQRRFGALPDAKAVVA